MRSTCLQIDDILYMKSRQHLEYSKSKYKILPATRQGEDYIGIEMRPLHSLPMLTVKDTGPVLKFLHMKG
jgi:hypothetical protein